MKKKLDLVTIGESMVVLTSTKQGYMRYNTHFERSFAGSEMNVAAGVSRMGHHSGWISRIGKDEFGKALKSFASSEGIDVSQVTEVSTNKTGLMFKEYIRENKMKIAYYRDYSAASTIETKDIKEEYIKSAKYLFVSGITPLLSESCYEAVMKSISIAKKNNVKVIFDPNIRKNLWTFNESRSKFFEILKLSDIFLPGLIEAEILFNTRDVETLADLILKEGPNLTVIKLGAEGAYYASSDESNYVKGFKVERIVDAVGAGDAFTAGLVTGLIEGLSLKESVVRANAFGAIVTQVKGDIEGIPTVDDLRHFLNDNDEDIER
ncbi:sugar kinase [Enterococcus songbeiensis]|uniref:sugar kinase n=1 Tax=Enterococcus songbeiensis TaxID=2559927 RepID=UPI0010F8B6E9|nr:sugar kinase [Enterococcus songbeiensis]